MFLLKINYFFYPLRSPTTGIWTFDRVLRALGKAHKTLGKWIAECNTQQCALGTCGLGKAVFAECFLSHARRIFYRVLNLTLGKVFFKRIKKHGHARPLLPGATATSLQPRGSLGAAAATSHQPPAPSPRPPPPLTPRRRHRGLAGDLTPAATKSVREGRPHRNSHLDMGPTVGTWAIGARGPPEKNGARGRRGRELETGDRGAVARPRRSSSRGGAPPS